MDFQLTEEQTMIYEYGAKLAQTYDRAYWLEQAKEGKYLDEMWLQMGQDGFLGLMVEEKYGGAGLGIFELALLMEGMGNAGIATLMLLAGPAMFITPIAKHGTPEQRAFYLPDACAGKTRSAFMITEPDAGTNSMRIKTFAKRDGDGFLLNGSKMFITGADIADHALLVARTTTLDQVERKTDGFTLFLLDMKSPGIQMTPIEIGITAPETQYMVYFDNVKLGAEHVLGEVDKGFQLLFDSLNPERILIAGMNTGFGRYALDKAVSYANERKIFEAPIGTYQGVQHPLAIAKTEIELASLMMRKAAWMFDQGINCGGESNMAKYAAAEAAIKAVDAAIQTHGGNGFTKEYGIFDLYPLVRLSRTAPINREIVLSFISEHVMGLPRSY